MKKMLPLSIGLMLVAVAAYYFLKKKDVTIPHVDDGPNGSNGSSSNEILDLSDINSIVDSLSMTAALKDKAKSWAKNIVKWRSTNSGGWSRSSGEFKAQDNGITYEQQCVLDGLWQMKVHSSITSNQYKLLEKEVYSLEE